jgi:hypothetical protein
MYDKNEKRINLHLYNILLTKGEGPGDKKQKQNIQRKWY